MKPLRCDTSFYLSYRDYHVQEPAQYVYVDVKLFLLLLKQHTMKIYGVRGGIAPRILNLFIG
jgi:hypothetical protein